MKRILIMSVLVVVFGSFSAYSGLISPSEFQGNLLNSVFGGGDGTAISGAGVICPDPNDSPYPLGWPTVCRGDLTLEGWVHVGYPGLLANVETFQKVTMAMWIKTDFPWTRQLFGRRYEWRMYIQGGLPHLGIATTGVGSVVLAGQSNVADGLWNHVAATYNGATGEAYIYVNGQQDGYLLQNDPVIPIGSTLRTAIGAIADTASAGVNIFDGYIDDIRVYDEILSEAQIYDIYRFTNESFCLNPPAADLTGDCKVGLEDLSLFVAEWLDSGWGE